ncbi:MAG: hypothetical protein QF596_08430 [Acidimicrobiales bacterium]|jgi:glyoxylase-like metal-dependent hydrolase (beta-lactamase superfamily II)|nr:hypothetical protein [Acidimicrobiales bacterium]HJM28614.1 hypothetical protein [Acidimicrobiales bacterium]HJM97991.1 hypothetical protein [Acidimicrobiales bacterium]
MEEEEQDKGPEPIVPGVARALSPLVRRILALNPGPHTSFGTNTYLIGIDEIVVIDPGPENSAHLDSVIGCGGDRIRWVTSTCSDASHAGAIDELIERTGAERLNLEGGETILGTEFRITVHDMEGPVANHKSFLLEEERTLICGKLVSEDTSIPLISGDSDLLKYHASFQKIMKMRLKRFAPAFGHVIEDPKQAIATTIESFNNADKQILKAIGKGAKTSEEIASANSSKSDDPELVTEIAKSVEVHLAKLADEKIIKQLKAGWVIR